MAVRIRLKRIGAKNTPAYRIVVTDARNPRDGRFIEEIGSYQPTMQEIPSQTVCRARVVVDQRESALEEAGDLLVPISQGLYSADRIYAELGEITGGQKPGRQSEAEITFFKSVGVAIQDLAAASRIVENAGRLGLGISVKL